jgi:hypothetical protein
MVGIKLIEMYTVFRKMFQDIVLFKYLFQQPDGLNRNNS